MNLDDYGPLLSAEAFFEIDFGERIKAELDAGIIYPLVRGPVGRVLCATNLLALLGNGAKGTGYFALGSLFAVTTARDCVRYPDVSVFGPNRRGPEFNQYLTFDDPVVAVHVMPADDRRWRRLPDEYMRVPSMRTLLLADWETRKLFVAQRTGASGWQVEHDWSTDVEVPALSLTIPHAEIFADD